MAPWLWLPRWCNGKESTGQYRRPRFDPLGLEDPLEQEMSTHSSVLAGKSHGQRSLEGYSHKELYTTE